MNKNNNNIAHPEAQHKQGDKFLKNHSHIKEIEQELIKGTPYRIIGLKYNFSPSALSRYKKKFLSKKVNAITARKDLREGDELLNQLEHHINNVNKLTDACMNDLVDPENPDKLFVGATANDIEVKYIDGYTDNNKPIYRRDSLQELINRQNKEIDNITVKMPDTAHTLIKASQVMNKHLHLFGELKGMLGNVTINITNQPVFLEFTQQILMALNDYPEARQKISTHLRTLAIEQVTENEEAESNE